MVSQVRIMVRVARCTAVHVIMEQQVVRLPRCMGESEQVLLWLAGPLSCLSRAVQRHDCAKPTWGRLPRRVLCSAGSSDLPVFHIGLDLCNVLRGQFDVLPISIAFWALSLTLSTIAL